MSLDPKNEHTFTNMLLAASRATNNVASAGQDLKEYVGSCAVLVNIGTKTVGDNDGAVTIQLQESDTNTASTGTNIASATVATTNNTTAHGTISVDPRARLRYIFARIILAGTNSPAYPLAVSFIGTKQVQS
jgi:hypothetical protein